MAKPTVCNCNSVEEADRSCLYMIYDSYQDELVSVGIEYDDIPLEIETYIKDNDLSDDEAEFVIYKQTNFSVKINTTVKVTLT